MSSAPRKSNIQHERRGAKSWWKVCKGFFCRWSRDFIGLSKGEGDKCAETSLPGRGFHVSIQDRLNRIGRDDEFLDVFTNYGPSHPIQHHGFAAPAITTIRR